MTRSPPWLGGHDFPSRVTMSGTIPGSGRVAGAEPLENGVGVATVHAAIVDGFFADFLVEKALAELMGSLVAAASAYAERTAA